MKPYNSTISLVKNSRGIYCLDTSIGCASGMAATPGGCYGDCYAAKSAKLYGHDFSNTVLRRFKDHNHVKEIVRAINSIPASFVRIGCSGDPSECWDHTIKVLREIQWCNKEIVIITRHWSLLSNAELELLSNLNLCINTSVSAIDDEAVRERSVGQYLRIQNYCKSILRIISCDFNTDNPEGRRMAGIQENLFAHGDTIDTVFRPSKSNPLVQHGIINVSREKFNGKATLASKANKRTWMGKCSTCPEQCGVGVDVVKQYQNRRGVLKQLELSHANPA